jgi:drug/metabolite transporter (DMT)-like permease
MTLLLAYIVLRETLHVFEVVNMLVSFCTVVFIVNLSNEKQSKEGGNFILGVLANLGSAFFFSSIYIVVRSLKDVHHAIVAAIQTAANLLVSVVVLLVYRLVIDPNNFEYQLTWDVVLLMLLNGLMRSLSQFFFIIAFQLDKAGRAASLNFLQIIFGYCSDILFFGYEMHWHEWAGSAVIVACSLMVFVLKRFQAKK